MGTEQTNPGRNAHRIRTRAAGVRGTQWELFQALLGFAYTVQQQDKVHLPAVSESVAEGLHPALERVAACARNLTEASGAAIALGAGDAMVCAARSGPAAPPLGARFDASSGLSGECIRTGQSAICVNAAADPRVNYQACRALNVASILYLPLRSAEGKMIGMLGVFAPRPLHFSQRDVSCLRFTEVMVQQVLAGTSETDPATLDLLLQQAELAVLKPAESESAASASLEPPAKQAPAPISPAPVATSPKPPTASRPTVASAKPAPTLVARIIDESVQDQLVREEKKPQPKFAARPKPAPAVEERRSRIPAMLAILAAAVIAFAAWYSNRFFRPAATPKPAPPRADSVLPRSAPESLPPAATHNDASDITPQRSLTAALTLRCSDANATVTVLLVKPIRFEGYQLSHPDRIYFDLHDVKLTDSKGSEFKNPQGLVSGIRLAVYSASITRMVFDLRQPATFEARLADNPQRLIIEIRRTDANRTEIDKQDAPGKVSVALPANAPRQM